MAGTRSRCRSSTAQFVASKAASRVYVVVLAAGQSRRLGRPKQLLELDGTPLVAHVVDRALAAAIDGVIVVTGADASRVELALRNKSVATAFHPDFANGQGTSLAVGATHLPDRAGAVIVLLGDMPGISSGAISRVAGAWRNERPLAAIARYRSGCGHPVLFAREMFPELSRLTGDEGARRLLKRLGDRVLEVPVDIDAPPEDVDTEEDWERLKRDWSFKGGSAT